MSDRCTPPEAIHIIRGGYLERARDDSEGAENREQRYALYPSMTRAQFVERLQTLSDDALVSLTADQGLSTFVIVESNRRLLVALQQEAASTARLTSEIRQEAVRTTYLTKWVVGLTAAVAVMTLGVLYLTWKLVHAPPVPAPAPPAAPATSAPQAEWAPPAEWRVPDNAPPPAPAPPASTK